MDSPNSSHLDQLPAWIRGFESLPPAHEEILQCLRQANVGDRVRVSSRFLSHVAQQLCHTAQLEVMVRTREPDDLDTGLQEIQRTASDLLQQLDRYVDHQIQPHAYGLPNKEALERRGLDCGRSFRRALRAHWDSGGALPPSDDQLAVEYRRTLEVLEGLQKASEAEVRRRHLDGSKEGDRKAPKRGAPQGGTKPAVFAISRAILNYDDDDLTQPARRQWIILVVLEALGIEVGGDTVEKYWKKAKSKRRPANSVKK